ncbi:hypothetical protein LINPERHAP1_LOCUS7136 [Linum perenne]
MTSPLPSPPPDHQPTNNNSPTHDEHCTPTKAADADAEEHPPQQELQDNPPAPLSEPSQTLTLSVSESQDNDLNQSDMEASHLTPFSATSASSRRGGGGGGLKRNKSKRFTAAKVKKLQMKLEALNENLNLIAFKPAKDLDFASHEEVLKRLGLWDFVNLKFDSNLRTDLVSQLIASYDPQLRASYVNEARVKVNRADLARALKLPAKKDKVSASEGETEVKESEEAIAFVDELVSTWMLLHDDTWMMPADIHNMTRTIKEGSFERFDWAGLIWSMVEKELSAAPNLGNCYYASHLQCLIKCQKENLLKEDDSQKEYVQVEEEVEVEEVVKTSEEYHVVTVLKEVEVEEVVKTNEESHVVTVLKEDSIELSLGGSDNAVKDSGDGTEKGKEDEDQEQAMVVEEDKEVVEEQGEWFKSSMDQSFLQHCSSAVKADDSECEEEKKQEAEQDVVMNEAVEGEGEGVDVEEVEGEGVDVDEVEGEGVDVQEVEEMDFDRSPKEDDTLDGVDSENLLESMEVGQGALSSEMQLHANLSSGDFLASRVDIDTNNHGSTSLYGNGNDHKRGIGQLDDEGDIPHHAFHKRIRSDEQQPYEEGKAPLESEVCFDQLQFWLDKARVSQMEKEKGIQEANENQQLLHNELQARAEMIQHLQNVRYAEDQKRRMEIYKLERELYMMGNLLEGYRKALKETHKSFADYRLKRPFPEEPLYKDTGIGGLVLTATEVEKLRKEEEERLNRLEIENKLKEFELEWAGKFQAHEEKIESLGGRLLDTEKNVNLLKEMQVKRSTSSPIAECPPTEQ